MFAAGVIAQHDVQIGQVRTVIGVQVRQHDNVDVGERDVLLQRNKGTGSKVKQDVPLTTFVIRLHWS